MIIDSVASIFRLEYESFQQRSIIMNNVVSNLVKAASDFQLAVVLTNQMTTQIYDEGGSSIVPALGENWGHNCTNRLNLYWMGNERRARLIKSSYKPAGDVPFSITEKGIRDC